MLICRRRCLFLGFCTGLRGHGRLKSGVRTIFIARSDKSKTGAKQRRGDDRDDSRESSLSAWVEEENLRKAQQTEQEYRKRLKELKSLTFEVADMIRKRRQHEKLEKLPMASDVNLKSDEVLRSIEGKGKPKGGNLVLSDELTRMVTRGVQERETSLLTPYLKLPESISERLGLSIRYLVSKNHQNWPLVLQQLKEEEGFTGIPHKDVRRFLYAIPRESLAPIVPMLDQLLKESKVERTTKVLNVFIEGLSYGSEISDERLASIHNYCQEIHALNEYKRLSRETYELMIQVYGKVNDLDKINMLLEQMKAHKLEPSPTVYNNVLKTCVYKAKDHKQAVEIFDSLKFISQKTKPGTQAYQDIIVSYVNNDDVEKALDLYREMIFSRIDVNQNILVALAKGCSSRPELKLKAWDFMFDIYNNGWEPTLNSYEYMIYLASKDSDVALARALYSKLSEANATSKRAFSFLLLAYSKSTLASRNSDLIAPSIAFHEKGKVFRRNLLSDSKIMSYSPPSSSSLPFLPVQDLTTKKEIMAESQALWSHISTFDSSFITQETTNTYLNIAAEMGTMQDFVKRFENATFFDREGLTNETRVIIEEPAHNLPKSDHADTEVESDDQKFNAAVSSQQEDPLSKSLTVSNIRSARTSLTYVIALKAAGKHKNYDFAKQIWSERGLFRKTSSFKNLTRQQKDRLDFQFAQSMVLCLNEMNLIDDAMAILLSTEYQFKWTWNHLRRLYVNAELIGRIDVCKTIKGIVKRAQIEHEGKIRRRDYKEYVLKRGY